ncbi:hypothetical protein AB0451_25540 [Streptomyces sp. NPDC052000]|uniref:hypothetical protein n=1 Tax=Streptomyces sp. NPDC052000 TaxID=3155676 RepID=UPI00344DD2A0
MNRHAPKALRSGPWRPRLAVRIANRRAANWTLENAPWTPAKAGRYIVCKPGEWGHHLDSDREANMTEVTVCWLGPRSPTAAAGSASISPTRTTRRSS